MSPDLATELNALAFGEGQKKKKKVKYFSNNRGFISKRISFRLKLLCSRANYDVFLHLVLTSEPEPIQKIKKTTQTAQHRWFKPSLRVEFTHSVLGFG